MFENLCGRNSEAATHLRSGLSILESWSCQTASQITVKEEYLRPIFTKDYEHVGKVSIPTTFGSVDDARKRLQMLLGDIYAEVNQAIRFGDLKMIRRAATEGMSLLRQWRCRFSTLRAGKDDDSHRAKILARLQVEWGLIMLAAVQLDDECGFDELTDTFRVIVEICEQLTVLESRLLGKEIKSPDVFTYGFDFNVLPPLNITAFKCRDPRIRRRGIALLSAGNRHEALWNFKTVGLLAQKTMELEEAGLRVDSCTDIPIGHRLQLMTVSYSPGVSVEEHCEATPASTPCYDVEWIRETVPDVIVTDSLLLAEDERASSWDTGSQPWKMQFHHKTPMAQWKMLFQPHNASDEDTGSVPTSLATSMGSRDYAGADENHSNLFWDHWGRLRRFEVEPVC